MTQQPSLPLSPPARPSHHRQLPGWRVEALRTTFWLVPVLFIGVAGLLFAATYGIDLAAFHHHVTLPSWINTGNADAGRNVTIAIAAAIITTVGVVFSITILALTLASQQFGPRMMRTFMRDVGNQVTLGTFVGTFTYSVLTLGAISSNPDAGLVPHLSITVSEALILVDVGVLIYFIHHIATTIQLPQVMSTIAHDMFWAIESEFPSERTSTSGEMTGPTAPELSAQLDAQGAAVPASTSGYLQFVGYRQLVEIASRLDVVIRLSHRPGHFVVVGRPLATVVPPERAREVTDALTRSHLTGPHRTLSQDPVFAIDQLVEIGIRALSSAVNDTFTALTCIDWLSAGLAIISGRVFGPGEFRDRSGRVRLIEPGSSYARMVNRAFDKIRQSGNDNPAVVIRLLDALAHVVEYTIEPSQRDVLARQATMVLRGAELAVTEPFDLADIRARYDGFSAACARMGGGTAP